MDANTASTTGTNSGLDDLPPELERHRAALWEYANNTMFSTAAIASRHGVSELALLSFAARVGLERASRG